MAMLEAAVPPRSVHVVVFGNAMGGAGKSTAAMQLAIALIKAGRSVATLDLDSRRQSLTRYVENRRAWARRAALPLAIPTHFVLPPAALGKSDEAAELDAFAEAVAAVESVHDFIVIDTPATDTMPMRLAHAMADTLVTPLDDSFVALEMLGRVDPDDGAVLAHGPYAGIVAQAQRQRDLIDSGHVEWIAVRNRLGVLASRNARRIAASLAALGDELGFRTGAGFAERLVFRDLFIRGLTVCDALDPAVLGAKPSLSHVTAREEAAQFVRLLRLPGLDDGAAPATAPRRAAADTPMGFEEPAID